MATRLADEFETIAARLREIRAARTPPPPPAPAAPPEVDSYGTVPTAGGFMPPAI